QSQPVRNQPRAESMTIFVITKGKGTVNLNREKVNVKENSMVQISPNTLIDLPSDTQNFTITGVSFTNSFLIDIGVAKRLSEVFNYFSSWYTPVWNLEPEDTSLIRHRTHLLAQRVKLYATHHFGREILIHEFNIFLLEVGA